MTSHSTREQRQAWARERQEMVDSQMAARGIDDPRVLAAMAEVPREEFVPRELRDQAYRDQPLPIGCDQTISQPLTVAFMAAALHLRGWEKVLEVGTGSGYGAAVLSHLGREIHTIERIPALARQARQVLQRLGFRNVQVHVGDGSQGLPAHQPFDAICVTAAAEELPAAYGEQLAEGGRIVIPVGPCHRRQEMLRYTKRDCGLYAEELGEFSFVPLIRGQTAE